MIAHRVNQAMAFCLAEAGLSPADLDAVAYSYDPDLAPPLDGDVTAADWEGLRTLYARRAPLFLRTSLPGLDPACVRCAPIVTCRTSGPSRLIGSAVLILFKTAGRKCAVSEPTHN